MIVCVNNNSKKTNNSYRKSQMLEVDYSTDVAHSILPLNDTLELYNPQCNNIFDKISSTDSNSNSSSFSSNISSSSISFSSNSEENDSQINKASKFFYGVYQKQQRAHEDRYVAKHMGDYRFYAVFDGHDGPNYNGSDHVVDFCVSWLPQQLHKQLININPYEPEEVKRAIVDAFIILDSEMYEKNLTHGTTCSAILVDDCRNRIYQINLGDSCTLVITKNKNPKISPKIVSASVNHNTSLLEERTRIVDSGGFILRSRVDGRLAVTRSFGDFKFKTTLTSDYDPVLGKVCATPDVKIVIIDYGMYVVLTSDAPYEGNAFNNKKLVKLFNKISTRLTTTDEKNHTKIAKKMVNVISPKTSDDVTIMVVSI